MTPLGYFAKVVCWDWWHVVGQLGRELHLITLQPGFLSKVIESRPRKIVIRRPGENGPITIAKLS